MKIAQVKMIGGKELRKKLEGLALDMQKVSEKANLLAAMEARTLAIKSIQEVSQGKTVRRRRQSAADLGPEENKYYDHVASRPGDPPNTDTGALVRSIAAESTETGSALVGTDLEYGLHLELGTSRMEARPWLGPAAEAVDTETIYTKLAQQLLKKAKV